MICLNQGSVISMKLEYIEVPRNISNDELISDMIRVSQILNKSTLTAQSTMKMESSILEQFLRGLIHGTMP